MGTRDPDEYEDPEDRPASHALRAFGESGSAVRLVEEIDGLNPDEQMFLEAMVASPPLPKYLAGARAGWSPAEVDRRMKDKGFAALVHGAEDLVLDGIEQTVIRRGLNGNLTAAQMVLAAKRPETWAQKREVKIDGRMTVSTDEKQAIMAGVVEALRSAPSARDRQAMIAETRQRAIEAHSTDTTDD